MRRTVWGSLVGAAGVATVTAALVPLRSSLSIASVGLILVVPVVAGVVTGGLMAGAVSAGAGFLAYDVVFIPPYYTLTVGTAQNWVALVVYTAVVLLVARVVSRLQDARREAQRRAGEAQRLLELSELLVTERSQTELLASTAEALRGLFGVAGVAVLMPKGDGLEVVAAAGAGPTAEELHGLDAESGVPVSLSHGSDGTDVGVRAVSLSAAGRPVGILALRGRPTVRGDRDLLRIFVNQTALAIEGAGLRERVLASEVLEQSDRLRQAMLASVSHDLRTPLATIKLASSSLIEAEEQLEPRERAEMFRLIEAQADRLTRLVTGLLDMSRYRAGTLELHTTACDVGELIEEAVAGLRPALGDRDIRLDIPAGLPPVLVDRVLVGQILVNLIDNAERHAPTGTAIAVSAGAEGSRVLISVADRGPGVPEAERPAVFESFYRSDYGGRAGLGLWICRTFVEAHMEQIRVDDVDGGGARFTFSARIA